MMCAWCERLCGEEGRDIHRMIYLSAEHIALNVQSSLRPVMNGLPSLPTNGKLAFLVEMKDQVSIICDIPSTY